MVFTHKGLRLGVVLRHSEHGRYLLGFRHRHHPEVDPRAVGSGPRHAADSDGVACAAAGAHRAGGKALAGVQGVVDVDPGFGAVSKAVVVDVRHRIDDLVHLRHRRHGVHRPSGGLPGRRVRPRALREPHALDAHIIPDDDFGRLGQLDRTTSDGEGLVALLVPRILHHDRSVRLLESDYCRNRSKCAIDRQPRHSAESERFGGEEKTGLESLGRHVFGDRHGWLW
mmetsp:Transcript_66830/g.169489  ORF Transcript_66830/g.169489 Transcript_66830/m.169489 type:complete len:226 (-) Transcript_66830:553-1230(-)